MNVQTHLTTKPERASERVANRFGDWWCNLGFEHEGGGKELHQFMAHPESRNRAHIFVNRVAAEYRDSLPLGLRPPQFSLRLDIFTSKDEMISTTEGKGHRVSDCARNVVSNKNFGVYTGTEVFDFIPATVKEVTGKDSVKTLELYRAQARLGYIVAPLVSSFVIRNVYSDQPLDEWRSVLSEPVPGCDGSPTVLLLERDGIGTSVGEDDARPSRLWVGACRLWVCRQHLLTQ